MVWTHFMDMHSGGGKKLKHEHIFIEAPQDVAEIVFYNKFGRNPYRVTCTCCGEDYSVNEYKDLAQATAYERHCAYDSKLKQWVEKKDTTSYARDHIPLEDYIASGEALFIYESEIQPHERVGELPRQGYVWMGD